MAIIYHACLNNGQDELHGRGRRVGNALGGGKSNREGFRCTSCGKLVESSAKAAVADK